MIYPNPKKAATVIVSRLNGPDVEMSEEAEVDMNAEGLKAAAEDVIMALDKKSSHDLMVALRSFFEMCDAAPHVEGEHS